MARITKLYSYFLRFDPGSAEVSDEYSREALRQALWRVRRIPDHHIEVETHEDRTDSRETGLALPRLDVLRRHFVAAGVVEGRLHMKVHDDECCPPGRGVAARRADIRLFPRVASLCPGAGDSFLSYHEVAALQSVRDAVTITRDEEQCRQLEARYSPEQWKRIIGHESLRQWAAAGARHPLYGWR